MDIEQIKECLKFEADFIAKCKPKPNWKYNSYQALLLDLTEWMQAFLKSRPDGLISLFANNDLEDCCFVTSPDIESKITMLASENPDWVVRSSFVVLQLFSTTAY